MTKVIHQERSIKSGHILDGEKGITEINKAYGLKRYDWVENNCANNLEKSIVMKIPFNAPKVYCIVINLRTCVHLTVTYVQ